MLRSKRLIAAAALVVVGAGWLAAGESATPAIPSLTVEQFRRVRELARPLPDENPWDRVRWVSTLWQAHERAAVEGKPIVVFTTGGEPLGIC